ncbi:hypothetical protein FACS1894152_3710 [Bacilli bacterium]|nr:hypothetical protein FACS1894152_3710 [Bacilli bacterium]
MNKNNEKLDVVMVPNEKDIDRGIYVDESGEEYKFDSKNGTFKNTKEIILELASEESFLFCEPKNRGMSY